MFEYQTYFRNRVEKDGGAAAMESYDDRLEEGSGEEHPLGEQRLVAEVHRMWLVAATAKICHEEGPGGVRLPYVARRAGVTPATAERLLGTAEACLVAAFRKAAALAGEIAIPRFALETDPVERVRVGATQLLGFGETEPQLTAVLLCRSEATRAQEQAMGLALSRIVAETLVPAAPNWPTWLPCTSVIDSTPDVPPPGAPVPTSVLPDGSQV